MVDRFVDGLKPAVKPKVLKSHHNSFEWAKRVALNADSAIWQLENMHVICLTQFRENPHLNGPTPTDIGNAERRVTRRTPRQQEQKDIETGAWFTCPKVRFRPWKHQRFVLNNAELEETDEDRTLDGVDLED